jgi:formylglycine-generating enzyme required for sulfatase activity
MIMKTKLHSLFIGLALLAGVHSALAQPVLSITPAGKQTHLYWPAADTNYVLQSSTNLVSPNWAIVTGAVPVTVNSAINVTVTNTSLAMFFRLYNTNNNTAPAGMALIPAGSFMMGNSIGDSDITDATPTNVTVSAFYMDVNLVSSNQWAGVYSYATSHGYAFVHAGLGKAANHPVYYVDWYDCVKWSNARAAQAGLTPVYYTDAGMTQVFTNGDSGTTVYANWGANGYRLPTEAEWEKAARGGLSGQRFPWGNVITENLANYYGATGVYSYDLGPDGYNAAFYVIYAIADTSPVGYFAPNGYGLNDMAGNVLEWCWDWYAAPPYPTGSPYLGGSDPRGPGTGSVRVVRGGDWYDYANAARCANRIHYNPIYPFTAVGFRCVRGL